MDRAEAYQELVKRAVELGREYVLEHTARRDQILQSYWWEKHGCAPPAVFTLGQHAEVPWPAREDLPHHREILTIVHAVAGLGGFDGMQKFYDAVQEAHENAYLALRWNFEGDCGWVN